MEIRFAIIPDASISKKAGVLGKNLGSKFPRRFLVDNKNYFPHATLFKIDLPKKHYKQLLFVTSKVIKKIKSFDALVNDYDMPSGGWIGLKITPSKKLLSLREKLFNEIKSSNLGDARMKPGYRPHITLARFYSDKRAVQAVKDELVPKFKMKVKIVGLCLSKQTQVYKIVDSVKLS